MPVGVLGELFVGLGSVVEPGISSRADVVPGFGLVLDARDAGNGVTGRKTVGRSMGTRTRKVSAGVFQVRCWTVMVTVVSAGPMRSLVMI